MDKFTVRFEVKPPYTLEEVKEKLQERGLHILFSIETPDGDTEIVAISSSWPLDPSFATYAYMHLETLPEIDWEAQWKEHVPLTKEGLLLLQIPHFGPLYLRPGAGFGNLSHPTTGLMREMMKDLAHKIVIDVGSGSGILSLIAAAQSAASVVGIDLDEKALLHAEENASLNHLHILFCKPEECTQLLEGERVILMNMIRSEQAVAWKSLPILHKEPAQIITSGILEMEEETYLAWTKKQNWHLLERHVKEGWLGLIFEQS